MPMTLDELTLEARKLSPHEQAVLADSLVSSIDSGHEGKWLDEAERRYSQFLSGKIAARPSSDVLKDAFARIGIMK